MKSIFVLFQTILLVFILSSCSIKPKLVFYNNTEFIIEIKNDKDLLGKVNGGHEINFSYPITQNFSINTGETNWIYKITNYPPVENYRRNTRATIYMQIESTGKIYVLKTTEEFPLTDFNNQPPGFPLKPINLTTGEQFNE